MKNQHTLLYMVTALLMTTTIACTDDDGLPSPVPSMLTMSETEVELSPKEQYYTVTADIDNNSQASVLRIKNDATWCAVADTVAYDGVVEFHVEANDDTSDRCATICIVDSTATSQTQVATITLTQHGTGYDDSNADDATTKFQVGYGYNVFKEFNSDVSSTETILDLNAIASSKDAMVRSMIQYVPRSREEVTHIVANSVYEMAALMEKEYNKTTQKCTGSKKTISRFTSQASYTANANSYSYIKLTHTVASAALDYSVFQYCIDNNINIFTDEFNKVRKSIIKKPNDTKQIDDFLNKYGSHIVTATDLGGMMDLVLNFSRTMKGEPNLRAEDFSDFFFHDEQSDYLDMNGKIDGLVSNISTTGTFKIVGGKKEISEKIQKSLAGGGQQITSSDMLEWQQSIEGNPLQDGGLMKRLAAVNFTLAPIWNLFPKTVEPKIYDRVLVMAQKSNNSLDDYITGLDNYQFSISKDRLASFGTNEQSTLVRVVYANNSGDSLLPVLEVCNEYVPKIRSDRRINVIYGINKGRTYHGAGLFSGDGEGNPPAWLTFSDGECYVKPIDGYSPTDIIDSIYYMRGNLYVKNFNISTSHPRKMEIKDQYLQFSNSHKYPIVKLGSGYWTRCNIKENMMFGTQRRGRFQVHEVLTGNILFAEIFDTNNDRFLDDNYTVYGKDIDAVYGKRTKWYIPVTEDRTNLTAYLGDNLKALFKNQVAGFDAEFVGYYGQYDILTGIVLDGQNRLGVDKYCCLAFKKDLESNEGDALLLTTDYTWNHASIKATNNNYYPIRLFRTNYFTYK